MTCKRCNGSGWNFMTDDPSPAGVSLSPGTMDCSEPCEDCFEQGKCPRCGETLVEYWTDGWTWVCQCGYDSEVAFTAGPIEPEDAAEDAHIRDLAVRLAVVQMLG